MLGRIWGVIGRRSRFVFWQNHLSAIASLFSTKTYYALAAEVAASSLPALQAGRLVAFEVRIEPAEE
jgi:hypothetical protein